MRIIKLVSYTLGPCVGRMQFIKEDVLNELKKQARQHVQVFRCDKHPVVDGLRQWACPECFKELMRENTELRRAESAQQPD